MESIEPIEPTLKTARDALCGRRPKRRRVDWHLDHATVALAWGRRSDALAAITAIAQLDPNCPQLAVLKARLDSLPGPDSRPYSRRWLGGVAAIVACGLLSGYSLYEPRQKHASVLTAAVDPEVRPMERGPLWSAPGLESSPAQPRPTSVSAESRATLAIAGPRPATRSSKSGARREEANTVSRVQPARDATKLQRTPRLPAVVASVLTHEPSSITAEAPSVAVTSPTVAAAPAATFAVPTPGIPPTHASDALDVVTVTAPAADTTSAVASADNDEHLVNQVLQRYRDAYAELDARSAREIWPRVNEAALARAFDDLRSQQITFDACNLEVNGAAASAKCRGSMRYVPKVGSHDPRIEPRVWSFSLRKQGSNWTIESARAGP